MKNLKLLGAFCSLLFLATPNLVGQSFHDTGHPCPPPRWCVEDDPPAEEETEGDGENGATRAADAVGAASEDPEDCYADCALGKLFFDLIRGLYPDCYPNCNLSTQSASNAPSQKPFGLRIGGGIKTYNYLTNAFPESQLKPVSTKFNSEYMSGGYLVVTGMYLVNKGKKNEYRTLKMEIIGSDKKRAYDTMYVIYDKQVATIVNRIKLLQINSKKSRKR